MDKEIEELLEKERQEFAAMTPEELAAFEAKMKRADARAGATALMSSEEFKKQNIKRWKEKLSSQWGDPAKINKMVTEMVKLSNKKYEIAAQKAGETGNIPASGKWENITRVVGRIMEGMWSDYDRYLGYLKDVAKEKDSGRDTGGWNQRQLEEYTLSIRKYYTQLKKL